MPKKKKSSKRKNTKKESENLLNTAKSVYSFVLGMIHSKIDEIKHNIIKAVTAISLFFLGALFILYAIVKYIPKYLEVSEATAFLIVGVTLLVIGIIYRIGAK